MAGARGGLRRMGTRAEERGGLGEVDGVGDAEHVVFIYHHLPPGATASVTSGLGIIIIMLVNRASFASFAHRLGVAAKGDLGVESRQNLGPRPRPLIPGGLGAGLVTAYSISQARSETGLRFYLCIVRWGVALAAKLLYSIAAMGAFAARVDDTAHTNAITDL
jgi:hypothetical protein